jgi:hypothetical protein
MPHSIYRIPLPMGPIKKTKFEQVQKFILYHSLLLKHVALIIHITGVLINSLRMLKKQCRKNKHQKTKIKGLKRLDKVNGRS